MRVGQGYDVHRLVAGRPLLLGGVEIPYSLGLQGHSDADAALHALMDALLGAAGLGDIGQWFPDTDPAFLNADSLQLLAQVRGLLADRGWRLENADLTIVAQAPKLSGYMPLMVLRIAQALQTEASRINVKATTEEGLGFTGAGLGIAAFAVVLIERA